MSVPQTLFLDTSVFDGFKYNFESATVRAFIEGVEGGEFSLLIPEPTYQEIIRHIDDHSDRAAKAISGAGKKEPFLRKLAEWPLQSRNEDALRREMKQVAMAEFTAFLREFKIERLGYEGINILDSPGRPATVPP